MINILKREPKEELEPYFLYGKYITEGYDLIIGPGCIANGDLWEKAIYCVNYLEILESEKKSNKTR